MPRSGTLFLFLLVLVSHVSHAQTLNLLTWEAYFSDAVIRQWEEETGASINQVFFDKDEVRNTILFSSEATGIDIVVLDPTTFTVLSKREFFLPVSRYAIQDNLQYLDPDWAARCGEASVPYMWGSMGLVYRRDKLNAPHSWNDLIHPPASLQGHIGLVENYVDTLVPALILRQQPVMSEDEEVLKQVFEDMRALLPWVLTFDYSISFLANSPQADQLYLALAYSGDEKQLNLVTPGEPWTYVIPDEGSMRWGECLAILNQSHNAELAANFINFLNTPEIAARNSEDLGIATSNLAALPLLSEATRNDPLLYPQGERLDALKHYDNKMSIRNVLLRDRITSTLVKLHASQ
ncbi:MAG: spermidine/putrescine ABC transporter substrate-binding protein [Pseudomonadales bacterium]|nr:spermidine/putrescine ABC transporter substrate-binding protein [Pseudomonadales bacterium]MCP5330515.1 spermidine/putrescine ABC transporter substrate-binding protein [Pseudomonadales bacterium]MCP5344843.1 spermidine/putrescine ABC transporter substrate-binding protein [Pseudomonadales bacterium]